MTILENALFPDQVPEIKFSDPDVEGLVAFLVGEKSFNEERVRKACDKVRIGGGGEFVEFCVVVAKESLEL